MSKKKVNQYIWQDLLIALLGVLIICFSKDLLQSIGYEFWTNNVGITVDESLCINIIITQYTITFLIVSLLSLLSGSGEYVYWVDVLEQKIIAPRLLNFTSMSVYAFVSMFAGSIAFLVAEKFLVLVFFAIDVVMLVFLTFRMTSVYFGKERLRCKLFHRIRKEIEKYLEDPTSEKLQCIEEKLNEVYENAAKMAEKKQLGEILDTDFQLLIDISEMMNKKYDNDLAKILYGNITKILLIFEDSSEYIFSRLNTKYSPFTNNILQTHTIEMLQSALGGYFEKVLSDGKYQISHDFWIRGIYRNLTKSYFSLLHQKNSTVFIVNDDYHNYEGEILFHHVTSTIDSLKLLEAKHELIHEKILRFSMLIYENSPYLFFSVVNEYGMPIDIMKEIDILGLICDNENLCEAVKACTRVTEKIYILQIARYIEEYSDYKMTNDISQIIGDREFHMKLVTEIKENAYCISKTYKDMVYKAAFIKKAPRIAEVLLVAFENSFLKYWEIIDDHFNKFRKEEEVEYKLLFNEDTYNDLVTFVQIKDKEFYLALNSIRKSYPEEEELCGIINRLIELFKGENNIKNKIREMNDKKMRESFISTNKNWDIRKEWT